MGESYCKHYSVSILVVSVAFILALSIQLEFSDGRVLPNEREFLVEPHLGLAFAVRGVTPATFQARAGSVLEGNHLIGSQTTSGSSCL